MTAPPPPTTTTPRGEARRQAFLDAALQVFLEHGLADASVNDVVRLAGGSLATLYAQFGSKDGLFLAMMAERVARLVGPLQQIGASHLPLAEGLQEMGERFLEATLQPEGVALYRIVLAEARKYPGFAEQFRSLSGDHLRAAIITYLRERIEMGEARAIDTDWAATFFIELVRARHVFLALTTPGYALTPEQITDNVARAVDVLINGIKAR